MIPETPWKIRRATPRDADALGSCLTAAYRKYAGRIDDLPDMAGGSAEDIRNKQVWVAETESGVVGGLVLSAGRRYMMLANVATHPDHQGTGLGRALINLAEEQARAQGFSELRLNTHADMRENITFYTRLGWREIGRTGNTVSMRKPVS